MQRVALINWKNKNQDFDLSKIFSSIATSWVVEGLEVQNWKVTSWYAFIEVYRAWVKFNVLFQNTEDLVIDTTGTKKVFIEINQSNIDDWISNSSDWTWIWEIKTASSYPAKNFIALASITSWSILNEKNQIKFKPLQKENIFFEISWIYPRRYKLWKIRNPDTWRFKIDLVWGVGYGNYWGANGGALVTIIWGMADWVFTIGGNWTEHNNASWITEIKWVETSNQEFDLYIYINNGSNPYGAMFLFFEGSPGVYFTKDFAVATPTWGVIFPKITPWTEINGLSEKNNLNLNDFYIVSDSENGYINKKIKLNTLKATTLENQNGTGDGYVSSVVNKKIFLPNTKVWNLDNTKSTISTSPTKLKEFWIYAGGTFDVYFLLRRSITAWYARARIYKNWVPYWTARETLNTSFEWFSEILSFSPWDSCQLYVWTDDNNNPAVVQSFQLYWFMVQEVMLPALLLN